MLNEPDAYQDLRDAVRQLCSQFPDAYFREVDERRGYPEAFVDALMQAGWLGAMIPEAYGGPGLGLAEAHESGDAVTDRRPPAPSPAPR